MLYISPARSNAQRQAEFRAAHPGYFRKYRMSRRVVARAEQNAQLMTDQGALPTATTMGMAAMASFPRRD